jgi:hypothetical protein
MSRGDSPPCLVYPRRALIGVLVLVTLISCLTGCGAHRPHPYLAELKQLPGASLIYPGSVVDRELGHDSDNLMGGNPAEYGQLALTNASPEQVLDYFNTQLTSLGWTRDDSIAELTDSWTTAYGWTRNGRSLQLGFYGDDGKIGITSSNPGYFHYQTVYSTNLQ